jgi:hypothetical protein
MSSSILPIVILFSSVLYAQDLGVRLLLGLSDKAGIRWDGSVSAQGAAIAAVEPWRFQTATDRILTGNSWKCQTRAIQVPPDQPSKPVVANGVIVRLKNASANASLNVQTVQGGFTVSLSEIPYGAFVKKLNNRVMVDRIPAVTRLTSGPNEQDYPAVAASASAGVWLAWMEFTHSAIHNKLRADFITEPASFDPWATPTGGDQIWVRSYTGGAWSAPIAITGGGGDLYRPAISIDGQGNPWVFWPAQHGGNFDLWARRIVNGQAQDLVRITSEAGSDVDPVAATDSAGRVWVAWQGWRNGRASIFAARQDPGGFTAPQLVSSSSRNEWNPAVAADGSGQVTVAWDSYRNGNYDVYMRTAQNGAWLSEKLVAGSARYEAYPSATYAHGRLWVAFEEGPERWGKDFAAQETSGLSLYSGRAIRLLGFEANGQAVETNVNVGSVLPGIPSFAVDDPARQAGSTDWFLPKTESATQRKPNQPAWFVPAPRNTSPRLHADASGRLWLAARSSHPIAFNPLPMGTIWSEYVVSYAGGGWTGPVFLSRSDNILDNRPAITSTGPGQLLVVGSSDSRWQLQIRKPPVRGKAVPDAYNNDLFANEMQLAPASGPVAVKSAPAPAIAGPHPEDAIEREGITRIHTARPLGKYKIVIGEFHRHSELSHDGGNDGSLLDQFRYVIDPASMDWVGCCDHDNGSLREYPWWITQKLTDVFYSSGEFVPMFSYERSVGYPEGHRNVVFVQRGIHPLPNLPKAKETDTGPAKDTQMLYRYLRRFNGIVAAHSSATKMGTDWRNNDPLVETSVEIYQGERQNYERPDAPRANSAKDSIGSWRPKGFVNLALSKGYKLGFQSSSDHISTHVSYCNLLVEDYTRESVLDAFKKRHLYGATDAILAEVTSGGNTMGDAFSTAAKPELKVSLEGTAPFAKVHIVKDNKYVFVTQPGTPMVNFTWQDNTPVKGKQSYYYVRGEQQNGEIVWASPMWITYTGN